MILAPNRPNSLTNIKRPWKTFSVTIASPSAIAFIGNGKLRVLGVVKTRYVPFQNHEAFTFADNLVDSGEAKYEAVISLKDGAKVSLLARLPREVSIGDDKMATFVLLSNSHDGSSAITLFGLKPFSSEAE